MGIIDVIADCDRKRTASPVHQNSMKQVDFAD